MKIGSCKNRRKPLSYENGSNKSRKETNETKVENGQIFVRSFPSVVDVAHSWAVVVLAPSQKDYNSSIASYFSIL
jgi:hypothetical protein